MRTFLYLSLALMASAVLAPADSKDSAITREQADEILKELRAIRELLARGPNPNPQQPAEIKAKMKLVTEQRLGPDSAPVTIVEFGDYQCQFCQQFHLKTFPELKTKYIDTGKVRFVVADFALDFHPNARTAAEATHCAAEQGEFWRFREAISGKPENLARADLLSVASSLKLDPAKIGSCLDSGKYTQAVKDSARNAAAMGVGGTPTFLIGKTTAEGVDGTMLVGAVPIAAFEAAILAANEHQ